MILLFSLFVVIALGKRPTANADDTGDEAGGNDDNVDDDADAKKGDGDRAARKTKYKLNRCKLCNERAAKCNNTENVNATQARPHVLGWCRMCDRLNCTTPATS